MPDNDPVIRFRGEDATKQFTHAKKPFSRLLEDGPKPWFGIMARSKCREWGTAMLAEKFFLMLESLIKTQGQTHSDGSPRIVSTSPHVPVQLPTRSGR